MRETESNWEIAESKVDSLLSDSPQHRLAERDRRVKRNQYHKEAKVKGIISSRAVGEHQNPSHNLCRGHHHHP